MGTHLFKNITIADMELARFYDIHIILLLSSFIVVKIYPNMFLTST